MSTGLIDIMKRAALDAVDNSKICDLRFGKVVSISPLKIQITNQFTIPENLLIVPEKLTDYEIETTITTDYGWKTEEKSGGNGEESFSVHNHEIKHEKKKIKIHNALKIDDKVVLIRKQGGQLFYILDRLPKERGE